MQSGHTYVSAAEVVTGLGGVLTPDANGYKVSIDVVSDRRFDVQQPIYKRNDANCCPSAVTFTKYLWVGQNFDARKGPRYAKAKQRFFDGD